MIEESREPGKARLLVVDDEPIALRNLERVLAKEGYAVTTAASGQAALKLLRPGAFDLVLTDLRMEKVDGMEVLRRARENDPDLEVILITGYASIDAYAGERLTVSLDYDYYIPSFDADSIWNFFAGQPSSDDAPETS